MSIILDALRKSEDSRLRQDHPAIFVVGRSPARRALPTWVLLLGILLVINLLLVAYVIWRQAPAVAPITASPSSNAAADGSRSGIAPAFPTKPESTATSTSHARVSADTESTTASDRTSGSGEAMATTNSLPSLAPKIAAPTRDDLLARGTNLPAAELNMHVYDANVQARFILLNGQRLREGETSSEGLMVERITPDGVILRFGTSSFAVNLQ